MALFNIFDNFQKDMSLSRRAFYFGLFVLIRISMQIFEEAYEVFSNLSPSSTNRVS